MRVITVCAKVPENIVTKSHTRSLLRPPLPFNSTTPTKVEVMSTPPENDCLTTPLLSSSSSPDVVVDVDSTISEPQEVSESPNWEVSESQNPFEFIGAPMLSLPPPCSIDPFRNHTEKITGVYEWAKILVCLPIALIRLVVFGIALAVGYVATKIALYGWRDKHNPMPRWRCRIMWVTRISTRCILLSFGYHWIRRIGRPASRETAPIIVSNHVSYIDPIFFFYELFPTMVSSESHDSIPFVGTIIRAMQVIYVDRFSRTSRKYAVSEIKRKALSNQFPRVLLFPEGTTTNGRALISFQLGAFIPGLPVQPVVIRYPHVHFDQSWGNITLSKLMFRMFTQFHNFMEVEYLPVVTPPSSKLENASCFAEKTSFAIASALNVVQTCHSYGDLMLLTKALQVTKEKPSVYMVEMARVQNMYGISTMEAMEFLDKFLAMNPDSNGRVQAHDFVTALKLGTGALAAKVFEFIDVEKKGSITFRQYLLGSLHILSQPSFQQICGATFDAWCDRANDCLTMQQLCNNIPSRSPGTCAENIAELFRLLDTDEDGFVDRNDFMTFMRKTPLLIAVLIAYLRRDMTIDIV